VGVNANGALGTGPVTVSGNGHFVIADGLTITNDITASVVNPGAVTGLIMVNNNTNGTVTTVSGPLSFGVTASTGGDFAGPTSSGYLNVLGPVTTGGSIVSVRFGNLRFSGGGSYSELQVRADTTSLGANNGVPTNAVLDLGGNGSSTVPTYFDLNGFNQTVAGLKNTVTPANLGIVTNSGGTVKTLVLDLGTSSFAFGGYLAGKVAVVLNAGTQSLNGTNNYTGNTTVNGGTLAFATASLNTNSTITVATGATLQLDFADTNRVAGLVLGGLTQSPGVYNNASSPAFITGIGSLEVVSPVNTTPTNLVSVINGNKLELSWPADHLGWRLQSQTNSLTSGLGTNWVEVTGSATATSVTNTINAANGAVFYRMVYP
jgi:autotransporter-associated beta strand protein